MSSTRKSIIFQLSLICSLALLYSFCSSPESSSTFVSTSCSTPSSANVSLSDTVEYTLQLNVTWSATTHPINFPANAHLSPLIGAVHSSDVTLWETGSLASVGIERMAETGSTTTLSTEIRAFGDRTTLVLGRGINSPGSLEVSFSATQSKSQITFVSMIAPSHDWFLGIRNVDLIENDQWIDGKSIQLRVYDAGTEEGDDFSFSGRASNPHTPITRLVTPAGTTDFGNNGNEPGTPFIGAMHICRK